MGPSYDEVLDSIKKFKNNKAVGSDGLPGEIFKNIGQDFVKEFTHLIGRILKEEKMPDECNKGIIYLVHKKGDPLSCNNYRGIFLLNTAYKVVSNIIFDRLLPYVENNIKDYQCGFFKGISTMDQIFTLKQILEKTLEYAVETYHLLIDFQAAYDRVNRDRLYQACLLYTSRCV